MRDDYDLPGEVFEQHPHASFRGAAKRRARNPYPLSRLASTDSVPARGHRACGFRAHVPTGLRPVGTCPGMTGVYSSLPNTSLPSIHTHSQFSDYFLIRLDFHPSRTISFRPAPVKRALRGCHEAERDATDPSRLSGPSRGKQSPRSARRGLAGRQLAVGGGRPKDPANAEDRVSVKARCAVGCFALHMPSFCSIVRALTHW
jgi:hypothetical protein